MKFNLATGLVLAFETDEDMKPDKQARKKEIIQLSRQNHSFELSLEIAREITI